nr:MAG TPA: hypothetical protein [Caudoviricetes sp.]
MTTARPPSSGCFTRARATRFCTAGRQAEERATPSAGMRPCAA